MLYENAADPVNVMSAVNVDIDADVDSTDSLNDTDLLPSPVMPHPPLSPPSLPPQPQPQTPTSPAPTRRSEFRSGAGVLLDSSPQRSSPSHRWSALIGVWSNLSRRPFDLFHIFSAPFRRGGDSADSAVDDDIVVEPDEDGLTGQQYFEDDGLEDSVDEQTLLNEGQYDVTKIDFTVEQARNYRFVSQRTTPQRAAWFDDYHQCLVRQRITWSGVNLNLLTDLQLKQMARVGIPANIRPLVWSHTMKLAAIKQSNAGVYQEICQQPSALQELIKIIDKDLDRTFVNHPSFRLSSMLSKLRRILIAFASHRPIIGYCQSLNFLAGFLLLFYIEEDAFWMMIQIVDHIVPPDYFTDNMIGIHTDLNVLAELMAKTLPKLHKHLTMMCVDIRPICFPMFLSLFIKTLPIESSLRVWDCLVMEGSKVLFRVALGLLSMHEDSICRMKDFGRLYNYISTIGLFCFDCETLIRKSFALRKLSHATINRIRQQQRLVILEDYQEQQSKRVAPNEAQDQQNQQTDEQHNVESSSALNDSLNLSAISTDGGGDHHEVLVSNQSSLADDSFVSSHSQLSMSGEDEEDLLLDTTQPMGSQTPATTSSAAATASDEHHQSEHDDGGLIMPSRLATDLPEDSDHQRSNYRGTSASSIFPSDSMVNITRDAHNTGTATTQVKPAQQRDATEFDRPSTLIASNSMMTQPLAESEDIF